VRAAVDAASPQATEVCSRLLAMRAGPTAGPFSTWFLLDVDGKMLGRAPPDERDTIGLSYAFRDYFRGAWDLDARGRRKAYVSRAYHSEGDDDYEFAISYPIHDAESRWAGLLIATIPTGSALGSLDFSDAGDDTLTAAVLSPLDRERDSEPDPEPIFILHRRLGRGEQMSAGLDDLPGSGFVSRVAVRQTPFSVLVSVAYDGPLAGAAGQVGQ